MEKSAFWARYGSRTTVVAVLRLACVALLATQLYFCWNNVLSESIVNDDFRQNLFWAPSLATPELFSHDLLADYSRGFNPAGMKLLYGIAVKAGLSGSTFGKILSLALFLIFLAGAASLGRAIGGRNASLVVPLLVAFILLNNKYYFRWCMGGLARNFAFPLQVWMVYALFTRNRPLALIVTLISSLVHPQTFLLCLVSLVAWESIHIFHQIAKGSALRPLLLQPVGILILIVAAAIPLAWQAREMSNQFGPIVTRSDIDTMVEFEPGGRWWREKPLGLGRSLLEEFRGDDLLHRRDRVPLDLATMMSVVMVASFVF